MMIIYNNDKDYPPEDDYIEEPDYDLIRKANKEDEIFNQEDSSGAATYIYGQV